MFVYKFVAVLFIVGLVQAVPAPGHGALVGCCDTNEHCLRNECCVSFNQLRGKRSLTSSSERIGKCKNISFTSGHCVKRGTLKSDCYVNNVNKEIYFGSCPCKPGLTCSGNGMITIPLGETGYCSRGSVKG